MPRKVARDPRVQRDPGLSRADRALTDRTVIEDREVTELERLDAFRQSLHNSALPNLPKIPGYHVCWLTTSNPRDSVHARLRWGYELIRSAEIPGWDHVTLKSGDWEGCIGINEMVAAKIPLNLYEAYMREAHYDQPLAEEEKLNATTDAIIEQAQSIAKSRQTALHKEEGTAAIGKNSPPPPSFAEELGES